MTRRSIPFAALLAMYIGVITVFTLGPTPWRTRSRLTDHDVLSPSTWLDPDTWVRVGSPEFIANILLFLPLGLLMRLAVPRVTWLAPAVFSAGLSVAIEVLQMATPRVSDPRDIVANTAGALLGVVLASVILAARARTRDAVARRGLVSAAESSSGVPGPRGSADGRGVSTDSDLTRAVG